jgi:hypothetical protein
MTRSKGCWIDELTPAELGTLDVIERDMVLSELEHRGKRLAELETTTLLATVLLATTPPPSNEMPIDPTALAEEIAKRVAERLGSGRMADIYTTRKGGPHIPGKSRDWMLRRVKEMPGARKVDKDWQIARTDFEQWLTNQDAIMCRRAVPTANRTPNNVRDIAEAALARAGLRPTR